MLTSNRLETPIGLPNSEFDRSEQLKGGRTRLRGTNNRKELDATWLRQCLISELVKIQSFNDLGKWIEAKLRIPTPKTLTRFVFQ